jgi:hypothetical protein
MKLKVFLSIVALIFVPFASQAADYMPKLAIDNPGKKIAIVSIAANNFGGSLQGWNDENSTDLMTDRLNGMLTFTEELFAKSWDVIPTSSFASQPEFISLAGEQRDVGAPMFDGVYMPLFSKDRKQLVKALIDKDKVVKLAAITGADFMLVIYSEWAVKTGSFVPTSKPLTKNVVSIFNAAGKQVFKGRLDKMGPKTLGAFAEVYVDEETIDYWANAYKDSIAAMYAGRKK